ncbi:hypothetical protein FRC07_003554 [Ceratobasidium sp. 392]|nr:hypothetical protein FRC07_003554 [Ceratobasidium sp. 392]
MLPYQWQSATAGMLFVRGLIPANATHKEGMVEASITQSLAPKNMSRFHFYAPFIKVFSRDAFSQYIHLESWDSLIVYSQTTEILPNLVELDYWTPHVPSLCVFLSRSTEIINVPSMDIPLTGMALAQLADRSPNVCKLKFHPTSDTFTANNIPPQTFVALSHFPNLCSMVSNTAVLQPNTLELLGQLPKLANLKIIGDYIEPYTSFPLRHQLPASSFPSLATLDITLGTSQDVETFWELVPLRMLTTVHIYVELPDSVNILQFVPSLCTGSPLVQELLLDFYGILDRKQTFSIQADMVEHLWPLPLSRSFSIFPARFDFDDIWENHHVLAKLKRDLLHPPEDASRGIHGTVSRRSEPT